MKKTTARERQQAEDAVLTAKAIVEYEPDIPTAIEEAILSTEKRLQELKHLKSSFTDRSISIVEDTKNDLAAILR